MRKIDFESITSTEAFFSMSFKDIQYLRVHQLDAQEAISQNKTKFLLQMPVGSGKTYLGLIIAMLFLEKGRSKKILYLTSMLGMQKYLLQSFNDNLWGYQSTVLHCFK